MSTSLSDRLRTIVGGAVPRVAVEPCLATPGLRGSLDAAGISRTAAVLGGAVVTRAEGPVVVVDRHYAVATRHGRVGIGDIARTIDEAHNAFATLGRAWPTSRLRPDAARDALPARTTLLFLDLETTGLAGGAGTRAFLVGCARLDEGGIATRQFVLPGDEHERALLAELTGWAGHDCTLVTFNGRTFDLPLIETRFLFHRLPFPLEEVPHVDMLHPARRLWKQRATPAGPTPDADRCSLSMLEKRLAGVHRIGDVPGYEIPSRYFQFVRTGDARPLEAVLEHNRLDLLSTALVMARTLSLIERGPSAATDPHECHGLARLYDRGGLLENAEAAYVRAIEMAARVGCEPEVHADALRRLAFCRRRTGRRDEAAEAWAALAELPRCPAALRREARESLAIHHEHRSRNLAAARALVQGLLDDDLAYRQRDATEYRLRRLERKLARTQPSQAPTLPLA
jgi:hypothetical protein